MAMMSDPILVAAATPVRFKFNNFKSSVNVQARFYSDAAGTVEIAPGSGSRDLTATNTTSAYSGNPQKPTEILRGISSGINNGTIVGAIGGEWYELFLGSGMGEVTISAAPNTTPGGSVTYRVLAEADGVSETG